MNHGGTITFVGISVLGLLTFCGRFNLLAFVSSLKNIVFIENCGEIDIGEAFRGFLPGQSSKFYLGILISWRIYATDPPILFETQMSGSFASINWGMNEDVISRTFANGPYFVEGT
mmetsp:Transcript_12011/g.24629  ORF Transcript_12011/g.24629 Transcript_12011/m.24629 type:complete len:116 (-) Transcript_12011:230-577(-)